MPKVSVIIPNYNHAQFLEQRIESVLNQTFQDFEVIFLDDDSTDNSKEVFSKYANHPKISHVIFNETNSGSPFKQWKKGFSLATGEYIWIAESDDYAELNFLDKLIPLMEDNVALAYCRSLTVNEINEISDCFWADGLDNKRWKKAYSADGLTEISNYLVFRNTIPNASSVLFRKEWANFDLPITETKYTGDWLFWINLLKEENRQIVYIPKQLNYFRSHSNSTRSRKSPIQEYKRFKEYFMVIDRALKISHYNFFDIISKRRDWFWIFNEFRGIKTIFSWKSTILPPFSFIFILLYYEYTFICLFNQYIAMSPLIYPLKKVLKSLKMNAMRR